MVWVQKRTHPTHSYAYNGEGERVSQTANGATTSYTLDLNSDLPQVLSDGANIYIPGIGQANLDGSAPEFYLTDANGSTRLVTDASGAVVGDPQNYDPFGNTSDTPSSLIGYTGEWKDASGLEYLRARYYDPSTGTFISKDPLSGSINNPASMNGYNYADDDPIGGSDPSGKCDYSLAENPIMWQLFEYSCLMDAARGVQSFANGNRDVPSLFAKTTGLDKQAADILSELTQLNCDVSTTFSDEPFMDRLPSALRLGEFDDTFVLFAALGYSGVWSAAGAQYDSIIFGRDEIDPELGAYDREWSLSGNPGMTGIWPPIKPSLGDLDEATLAGRQEWLDMAQQILGPYVSKILEIDPDAVVGMRGSVVKGFKGGNPDLPISMQMYDGFLADGSKVHVKFDIIGNPLPFNPGNSDIDAYIVSDKIDAHSRELFPGLKWKGMSTALFDDWNGDINKQFSDFFGDRYRGSYDPTEAFMFKVYSQASYNARNGVGVAERFLFH